MIRRRSLPPALLAAAALAAMLATVPAPAEAGCSSRVHPGGHPGGLGLAALAELTAEAGLASPEAPAPGRIPPCSGPSCSDGPGVPMAPGLLATDLWRELWCDAAAAPLRDRTGRPLARAGGPPPSPSTSPTDVERPPRPLAA